MKFGNYTINNPESFETPEYVILRIPFPGF